ncbi:MAG: chorismate mutase [Treponema sp.]|jgi:chorismate mutase|nr:chorismate mutase [Treponema sp.]
MKQVKALRGATQCLNEAQDIMLQVSGLYDELLCNNNLTEADLISLTFSVTKDINAKNPAAALRQSGRGAETALFTVQEAEFVGSLERVVRVLIHCYLEEDLVPCHVYRNGAEALRPDRVKPSV